VCLLSSGFTLHQTRNPSVTAWSTTGSGKLSPWWLILEISLISNLIDSPPSCPGLHDLRIACLNTYFNIKAISLHCHWPIIGLGDGDSDLHRNDWQVNTIDCPTKLVRQDAILGALSIGQLGSPSQMTHWHVSIHSLSK